MGNVWFTVLFTYNSKKESIKLVHYQKNIYYKNNK